MVKRWKPLAVLLVTFVLAASLQSDFFLFLLGFEALVIAAAYIQVTWLSKRLRLRMVLPSRTAFRGETFQIQAEMTNASGLPVPQVMARAAIRVFPEEEALLMRGKTMLGSHETGRLCFSMDCTHCACLEVSPNQLVITDYLGIAQRRCAVDETERRLLFVLPECLKREIDLPAGRDVLMEDDGEEERRGHTSADAAEIRLYQPGDPVKLIHWKLSARLEDLLVREMNDPSDTMIQLLLDLREPDAKEKFRCNKAAWDHFMETVASASATLLVRGHKHMVVWADAAHHQMVSHEVSDEESQQAMLCALLRTDSYQTKDYMPLLKEVASGEAKETCIKIDLQGRIDRTEAAR